MSQLVPDQVADQDLDRIKYQIFFQIKQKELYQLVYPICVDVCIA